MALVADKWPKAFIHGWAWASTSGSPTARVDPKVPAYPEACWNKLSPGWTPGWAETLRHRDERAYFAGLQYRVLRLSNCGETRCSFSLLEDTWASCHTQGPSRERGWKTSWMRKELQQGICLWSNWICFWNKVFFKLEEIQLIGKIFFPL